MKLTWHPRRELPPRRFLRAARADAVDRLDDDDPTMPVQIPLILDDYGMSQAYTVGYMRALLERANEEVGLLDQAAEEEGKE